MKTKTSRKEVYEHFGKNNVVQFGYCSIERLENYLPQSSKSFHYTRGVYGWNCDVYCIEGDGLFFCITSGYRPFGRYDEKIAEIGRKYESKISNAPYENRGSIAYDFLKQLYNYFQEK